MIMKVFLSRGRLQYSIELLISSSAISENLFFHGTLILFFSNKNKTKFLISLD